MELDGIERDGSWKASTVQLRPDLDSDVGAVCKLRVVRQERPQPYSIAMPKGSNRVVQA